MNIITDTDWIPVDVCPPLALLDVLVTYSYDGDPTVDLAFCTADGRWLLTGSEPEQAIKPTHWMPLPSPAGEPDSKIDPVNRFSGERPDREVGAGVSEVAVASPEPAPGKAWGMATLDSRRRGNDGR